MARTKSTVEPVDWLTITQTAEMLDVVENTAYRWARTGIIPARKIGGRWYLLRADIEGLLTPRQSDEPNDAA